MLNDSNLTLLSGQVLLEPEHPKASELFFVANADHVPATMMGRIVKTALDTKFMPGTRIVFVPHGGTLLKVGEGQPERMVLPADQILGTVED